MSILKNKMVTVLDQERPLEAYVDDMIYVKSVTLVRVFREIGMTVPKKVRMKALKTILNPILEEEYNQAQKTANEGESEDRFGAMRRLNRLYWYKAFTETELEQELVAHGSESLNLSYMKELWRGVLTYIAEKETDKALAELLKLGVSNQERTLPDMEKYNFDMRIVFIDDRNQIDGLTPDEFRTVCQRSSTVNELIHIGYKYGIDVPKTLKKADIRAIIFDVLERRGALTDALREELLSKTVKDLEAFAQANDIIASAYMSKEMIVEYILKNVMTTKRDYVEPSVAPVQPSVEEVATQTTTAKVVEKVVKPTEKEPVKEVEAPASAPEEGPVETDQEVAEVAFSEDTLPILAAKIGILVAASSASLFVLVWSVFHLSVFIASLIV
ncbi:MAG: hypothetical protein EA374_06300 [Acholeplasmatales bacterium]|nr:MAG: hypothetical protein EA374_06300 [Acholeplasmatales bacterium]